MNCHFPSIPNYTKRKGHINSRVTIERLSNGDCMCVISAGGLFSARPIAIQLWDRKNQILHFYHNQCLYKVTIYGIALPCTTGFYFKSRSPLWMPSIYLILKIRFSILAEENRALYFISCPLAYLNSKAQIDKVGTKYSNDSIAI